MRPMGRPRVSAVVARVQDRLRTGRGNHDSAPPGRVASQSLKGPCAAGGIVLGLVQMSMWSGMGSR